MPATATASRQNIDPHGIDIALDVHNQVLKCDGIGRHLSPKAATLLACLCAHPRQLLTKDELLETVWPGAYVVDAVLKNVIKELRRHLGDNARSPRFIETVHRRGYRFVGEGLIRVTGVGQTSRLDPPHGGSCESRVFEGRDGERQAISDEWALALSSRSRGVLISGDPGIGKSALVTNWLHTQYSASEHQTVCHVVCTPASAQTPFATMCEILTEIKQIFDNAHFAKLITQYAPSWRRLMPWLTASAENAPAVAEEIAMLHPSHAEANALLEALSDVRPLLVVVEGLQYCDTASARILDSLVARQTLHRLLVMATCCSWQAGRTESGGSAGVHDARVNFGWRSIELGPLDRASLIRIVESCMGDEHTRCAGTRDELAHQVLERSGGHPLFVSGVVQHYCDGEPISSLAPDGPDVFRQRMAREFRLLQENDRAILRAASVVTVKAFSAAAIANLLDVDLLEMEAKLDRLADRQRWLMRLEGRLWPDGTMAQSYGFRLRPYRDCIYTTLPLATRRQLHQRHARRVEAAYANELELVTENLAYHFEQGGDAKRASRYRLNSTRQRSPCDDRVVRMQLVPEFHPSSPVLGA